MKKVIAGARGAALALLVALVGLWPAAQQESARAQDPFPTPTLEWSWDGSGLPSNQVMMAPVVADVTGPGWVRDGIPDIIFTTFDPDLKPGEYTRHGVLRVLNGDGTGLWYSVTDTTNALVPIGAIAVGDIDGDGKPEIVGIRDDQGGPASNIKLIAFEGETGYPKWIGDPVPSPYNLGGGPTIADMNGDSVPEIVVGQSVYDNAGNLSWSVPGVGTGLDLSCVADLYGDGVPELITGEYTSSQADGFCAVADFDLNGQPEIVGVGAGQVWLLDRWGAVLWGPVTLPNGVSEGPGGPPCVADLDGDGYPEIGVANRTHFSAYDGSGGSPIWTTIIDDSSSGTASCSAFDFNGDGKYEIAYRDEHTLYIFGEFGMIWHKDDEPSYTADEMPVVADVDNDGHAEIVLPLNNYQYYPPGPTGIEVWGNDQQWAWSRKIWNEHTYHITNIKDNATVPTPEADNWLRYNNYRTQAVATPDYKCYSIPSHRILATDIVNTQFGPDLLLWLDAESLCAPALKDGEGDLTVPHLKCYEMDPEGHDPPDVVNLTDQFEAEYDVPVGPAIRFCEAVTKWGAGLPSPSTPPPLHYECFSIPSHFVAAMVTLETQFGPNPVKLPVEAESVCAPALKTGEGDLTAPDLKCYKIFMGDDPLNVVNLTDQFGDELDVPVGQAVRVCDAVRKEVISGVGGIAELPALPETSAAGSAAPAEGSGWSAGGYAALAAVVAVAAAAVAAGGWYARRHWLR